MASMYHTNMYPTNPYILNILQNHHQGDIDPFQYSFLKLLLKQEIIIPISSLFYNLKDVDKWLIFSDYTYKSKKYFNTAFIVLPYIDNIDFIQNEIKKYFKKEIKHIKLPVNDDDYIHESIRIDKGKINDFLTLYPMLGFVINIENSVWADNKYIDDNNLLLGIWEKEAIDINILDEINRINILKLQITKHPQSVHNFLLVGRLLSSIASSIMTLIQCYSPKVKKLLWASDRDGVFEVADQFFYHLAFQGCNGLCNIAGIESTNENYFTDARPIAEVELLKMYKILPDWLCYVNNPEKSIKQQFVDNLFFSKRKRVNIFFDLTVNELGIKSLNRHSVL